MESPETFQWPLCPDCREERLDIEMERDAGKCANCMADEAKNADPNQDWRTA